MTGTAWRIALLVPATALGLLLAGCDDGTTPAPVASAAAPVTPVPAGPVQPEPVQAASTQTAASPAATDTAEAAPSGATLSNDPSAPPNTPLCGFSTQESNAISRQLLSRQYAEAGQCSAYACYDAATATYIGADGYRHVCR